jgi:hypothetical protein
MHPKVTAIVCTSADLKNAATLAQLQSLLQIRQLPVLSPEFIYDSVSAFDIHFSSLRFLQWLSGRSPRRSGWTQPHTRRRFRLRL